MSVKRPERMAVSRFRAAVWAVVAVLVVVVGDRVVAEESTSDDGAVLAALDSPDFDVRRRATQRMLADASMTVERVAQLYQQAQSVEQRHRLLAVARHHYLRGVAGNGALFAVPEGVRVSGAIGVPQDAVSGDQLPQLDGSVVRVWYTFPGFPAHGLLQRDDLILAVNGQTLPRTNDVAVTFNNFLQMVKSLAPGQTVTLTVWRAGEVVEVSLVMANSAALSGMYTVPSDGRGPPMLDARFAEPWRAVQAKLFAAPANEDAPLAPEAQE